jgi:hypothetical protein
MLVAHRIAPNLKGKNIAIPHHIMQGNTLGALGSLDRQTRGDAAGERQTVAGARARSRWLRLCTRSNIPFFSRLVMCLCTVARLFSPMPRAISSNDGE